MHVSSSSVETKNHWNFSDKVLIESIVTKHIFDVILMKFREKKNTWVIMLIENHKLFFLKAVNAAFKAIGHFR